MLQETCNLLLEKWPYSDRAFWTLGMFLSHAIIWYSGVIVLYIIYNTNLFPDCKIQKQKWPDPKLTRKGFIELVVLHFTVQPLMAYFVLYPIFTYFGATDLRAPFPSPLRALCDIVACLFILDTYFYWVHRLMHAYPVLYRLVHKKHHTFTVTTGVATEYATTLEDVVLNYVSTFAGPMLVCSHPIVGFLFLALRMTESLEAHSGYQLPFAPWNKLVPFLHDGAKFHDFHHSSQVGNYGVFVFWDWLMGTDAAYKKKQANKVN